jgi:hypothetical protein
VPAVVNVKLSDSPQRHRGTETIRSLIFKILEISKNELPAKL